MNVIQAITRALSPGAIERAMIEINAGDMNFDCAEPLDATLISLVVHAYVSPIAVEQSGASAQFTPGVEKQVFTPSCNTINNPRALEIIEAMRGSGH